ncbi:MAG TPA: DeoR/GlpR family DNA-binding transcription regulator [Streptosporangiaceae bacterium]|nr:DeoR/GlpR family DNA-binding transcription regulator [Streptosporangiaceae bacterium]
MSERENKTIARSGTETRLMLAAQRQRRILAEVSRAGGVRVSALTRLLGVSDMTIRRDIQALVSRGVVQKVHGGVIIEPASSDEPGFEAKVGRERAAKEAIASAAARLVRPGTAVAVTAGTTTHALASRLAQIPDLTIVTNSLRVAEVLHARGDRAHQTVILTGGVRTPSDALVGPVAVAAVRNLHADVVLMGVHGMDLDAGFTTPNIMEAEMNRAMIASAHRLVVLADHTKWGVVGLSGIAALADAAVIVSDSGLTAEVRELIASQVAELIIANEAEMTADDDELEPMTGADDDGAA